MPALADILAADAEILPSGTNAALRRSVKPQELLSGEIDEFRTRFERGELIGKPLKPPQRHGNGAARGAAAGRRHHVAGGKYFEIG